MDVGSKVLKPERTKEEPSRKHPTGGVLFVDLILSLPDFVQTAGKTASGEVPVKVRQVVPLFPYEILFLTVILGGAA
jgi:hypothetical protein